MLVLFSGVVANWLSYVIMMEGIYNTTIYSCIIHLHVNKFEVTTT